MIDIKVLKRVIKSKLNDSPFISDKRFNTVRDSIISEPVLVHTLTGSPEFYIIPLCSQDKACGFVQTDLEGKIGKIGIFGASEYDETSWIPMSFFAQVPGKMVSEIKKKYSTTSLSTPLFSFYKAQGNFGWRIDILRGKDVITSVMINPHGWFDLLLHS